MRKFLIGLLGLLLIALLSYFCFLQNGDSIKQNLISKVNSKLNSNGYEWVNASLVGSGLESTNIVKLTGLAPSDDDKANAQALVSKIDGVGAVKNLIEVKEIEAKQTVQEPVKEEKEETKQAQEEEKLATKNGDQNKTIQGIPAQNYHIYMVKNAKNRLFLEGFVPSKEVHDELAQKAVDLFGKDNVEDNLKISKTAPKDWNYMSMFGLEKLAEVDFGDMNITGNSYIFKGHLSSHDKKIEFLNSIKKVMSKPDNHYGRYRGDYIVTAPVVKKEEKKIETANTTTVKEHKKEVKKAKVEKTAPKRNAIECQEFLDQTISSKKIHFKFNSYKISSDSYALLDKIADAISSCGDLDGNIVEIGGHTDSRGKASYNRWLSQKRAESVMTYLIKKGINQNELRAIGYGEDYPIADNKTSEGRAMNRRIEFKIKGE